MTKLRLLAAVLPAVALFSVFEPPAQAQVPSYNQPVLQRPTFVGSFAAVQIPQTGAGDAACLVGSATKTIYVVRVQFSTLKTTLQPGVVANLVKRTAANSGGSSAAATIAKMDSAVTISATAILNSYTAIPTPGAGANVRSQYVGFPAATGLVASPVVFDFSPQNNLSQPVVLRGVAQSLCLNFPAAFTTDGPLLTSDWTWTEQ